MYTSANDCFFSHCFTEAETRANKRYIYEKTNRATIIRNVAKCRRGFFFFSACVLSVRFHFRKLPAKSSPGSSLRISRRIRRGCDMQNSGRRVWYGTRLSARRRLLLFSCLKYYYSGFYFYFYFFFIFFSLSTIVQLE